MPHVTKTSYTWYSDEDELTTDDDSDMEYGGGTLPLDLDFLTDGDPSSEEESIHPVVFAVHSSPGSSTSSSSMPSTAPELNQPSVGPK